MPETRPARVDPATDAGIDALAELFLGTDGAEGSPLARISPPPRAEGAAPIEGLLVGHLPVLASPWVVQYARDIAAKAGGWVALLRLRTDSTVLELIGEHAPSVAEGAAGLEEAIGLAASHAAAWLIRAEGEAEALLGEACDRLTLLTGADEAAVVSAYRSLKALDGPGAKRARIAILGSTPARMEEVSGKLSHAARTFLGRELEIVACSGKIGGACAKTLYAGEPSADPRRVIEIIRRGGVAAGAEKAIPRPASRGGEDGSPPPAGPSPTIRLASGARPEREEVVPSVPSLAARIPTLEAMSVRCPRCPEVELGIGADGRLHVLARATRGRLGEAVRGLMAAGAWAREHASILRMTGGAARGLGDGAPAMHVFTDDPSGARSLLDADVRIHILAPVEVEGRVGWYCSPLN